LPIVLEVFLAVVEILLEVPAHSKDSARGHRYISAIKQFVKI